MQFLSFLFITLNFAMSAEVKWRVIPLFCVKNMLWRTPGKTECFAIDPEKYLKKKKPMFSTELY